MSIRIYLLQFLVLWGIHSTYAQQVLPIDTAATKQVSISLESIINTPNSEFSPVYYGENVGYVYSSSRGRQLDKAIDEPFYDLGYAARDTSGLLALSASFSRAINSLGHEGPFAIQGDNIFFTRVSPTNVNGKAGYTHKIFWGRIGDEEMSPLPFATDKVSVCHPTLSKDGLTMVFSADMTGAGNMDLYTSSYIGSTWSDPVPLVGSINTVSHEFFPNLYQDSILVFSSDRLGGYGGYDLYASVFRKGQWTAPQLLSAPFNSKWDDLGLIIRADGKKGYFTSNRPGGEGKDDIYNFKSLQSIISKPKITSTKVTYTVLDKLRFVPIANASIQITELALTKDKLNVDDYNVDLLPGTDGGELILKLSPKKGKELPLAYTNDEGKLEVNLSPTANYIITATAPDYETTTFVFAERTYGSSLDIILEPKAPEVKIEIKTPISSPPPPPPPAKEPEVTEIFIPKTKGATVIFNNLYYGYNSATLQKGAASELDALADAMLLNSNMDILLGSHTDSRGDSNYNLMLSEERALSAKNYLVERGINPSRIMTRGLGETDIRNKCKNGVPCTEEEHAFNRRTEAKILRI